jgi:hypothetical protein
MCCFAAIAGKSASCPRPLHTLGAWQATSNLHARRIRQGTWHAASHPWLVFSACNRREHTGFEVSPSSFHWFRLLWRVDAGGNSHLLNEIQMNNKSGKTEEPICIQNPCVYKSQLPWLPSSPRLPGCDLRTHGDLSTLVCCCDTAALRSVGPPKNHATRNRQRSQRQSKQPSAKEMEVITPLQYTLFQNAKRQRRRFMLSFSTFS